MKKIFMGSDYPFLLREVGQEKMIDIASGFIREEQQGDDAWGKCSGIFKY